MDVDGESEAACVTDLRNSRLNTYREMPNDISSHYNDEGENEENYYGRFAYELIQNADDAVGKRDDLETPSKARFELHTGEDPCLIVANTGPPVDDEDTRALTTIGDTTKRDADRKATIGHKGRGFSAVLEITEQPYVFSTDVSFMFDRSRSRECIAEVLAEVEGWEMDDVAGIPLMRLPFAPDQRPTRVRELLEGPFETVFYFPLRGDAVADVRRSLNELDEQTVLFLKNLEELDIVTDDVTTTWAVERRESSLTSANSAVDLVQIRQTDGQVSETTYLRFNRDEIPIGEHTAGISNNTWGDVSETQVSVAVRAERGDDGLHLQPVGGEPRAHVFLPTEERSPVPLLINGAFDSNLSRTAIDVTDREHDYNRFLIQEAANIVGTDIVDVARETATTAPEFLSCLDFTTWADPESRDDNTFRDELIRALQVEFTDVECVPIGRSSDEEVYVSPTDTLLPSIIGQARDAIVEFVGQWGADRVQINSGNNSITGYFPSAELLREEHAQVPEILRTLGAQDFSVAYVPKLIPELPDEWFRIDQYPPGPQRTATDPVVKLFTALWPQLDEAEQERFASIAREEPLVPVGVSADNGSVTRVSAADTELYLPPEESDLPVDIPSVQFVLEYVYRPRGRLGSQALPPAIQQRQSVIRQVWRPDEFQFEELVRTTVTPRIDGTEDVQLDDEMSVRLLALLEELGKDTVNPEAPLPLQERYDTQPLYDLCQLPVPTRTHGLCPAHEVYFGDEWLTEDHPSSVEHVFEAAGIDAPILISPEALHSRLATEGVEFEDGLTVARWRSLLRWLGVSPHLRLQSFFAPDEQRQFSETVAEGGVARPPSGASVLGELDQEVWTAYQDHLEKALDEMDAGRQDYDSIYQVNRFEYWEELYRAAREETETTPVGKALFNHLIEWWEPVFSAHRDATLATHTVGGFGGRNSSSQFDDELREVGTNLWLWQLKRHVWCPSTRGAVTPTEAWDPPEQQSNLFELDGHSLLPILRRDRDPAVFEAQPLLEELGIRQHLSSETFTPTDARTVCEGLAEMCQGEAVEIGESLRDIQPIYRQIQDLAPPVDEELPEDSPWREATDELGNCSILCRVGDGFDFCEAQTAYFARSPNIRADYPFDHLPFFVLEEQRSARFGEYFGLTDFTEAVSVKGEPIDVREDRTETLKTHLTECAAAVLCRLEAERPSQRLIDQDLTRMRSFLDRVKVVDEVEVTYSLDPIEGGEMLEETTTTEFYLESQYQGSVEERYPYIAYREHDREQWQLLARTLCAYLDVTQFEGIDALLTAASPEERRRYLQYANAPSSEKAIEQKRHRLHEEDVKESQEFGTPEPVNKRSESDAGTESESDTSAEGTDKTSTEKPETDSRQQSSTTRLYDESELRVANRTISIDPDPTASTSRSTGTDTEIEEEVEDTTGERALEETSSSNNARAQSEYDVEDLGMALAEAWEATRLRQEFGCSNPEEYVFRVDERHLVKEAREGNAKEALQELEEKAGIPKHFPGFDLLTVNPETHESDRLIELKSATCRRRKPSVSWNEWTTARNEWIQNRDTPLYYLYVVGHLSKTTNSAPYIRTIANPFRLLDAQVERDVSVTRSIQVDIDGFSEEGLREVSDADPIIEVPVEIEN